MTANHKQWIAWILMTLATLSIALFFGVKYPLPPEPDAPIDPIELGAHFSNPVDITGSSSAAAPALTFEGDTDTGIFRSAANTLNFSSGGAEMLEIDSSGFTISSGTTLVVEGGATISGGNLDVNDAIDQDGASDEVQLAVTGYTTQTSDLVQFDGGLVDIGGGSYATADGDNDLGIAGDLEVDNALDVDGNADIAGTLDVTGSTDLGSTLGVAGATSLASTLDVTGNSTLTGTLDVAGATTLAGSLDVAGNTDLEGLFSFPRNTHGISANGTVITPTVTYYDLLPMGAYTFTIADGSVDGQILILHCAGGATVTLDESEFTANIGGDIALAEDDMVMLFWDRHMWSVLAYYDN